MSWLYFCEQKFIDALAIASGRFRIMTRQLVFIQLTRRSGWTQCGCPKTSNELKGRLPQLRKLSRRIPATWKRGLYAQSCFGFRARTIKPLVSCQKLSNNIPRTPKCTSDERRRTMTRRISAKPWPTPITRFDSIRVMVMDTCNARSRLHYSTNIS